MSDKIWTTNRIRKLFRLEDKNRNTLFIAESKELIPTAKRISRGKVNVRSWDLDQIPEIGKYLGFLKKSLNQKIICTYVPKGGVLKTTTSYNIARILALNGIKVLIIGLDVVQSSITGYVLPKNKIESLEEFDPNEELGLYHFLIKKTPLEKIIKKTDLPTLDIIAETSELNSLERKLRDIVNRESTFKNKLVNHLSGYDVIILDNGPGWNLLVENSLVAANIVISPLGCDIEAFKAVNNHLSIISDYKNEMEIRWDHFIQIPTLLETNKLSQQIYGTYLNKYADNIIPTPIRRSIIGQEARAFHQSVIEYDPSSHLADDYFKVITEIWNKINQGRST